MSKRNTSAIGDLSVTMVIGALLRSGRTVLTPFGDHHRYDLVVADGESFKRIQCKTARYYRSERALVFNAYSVERSGKTRCYTADEIDAYGVYSPDLNRVYLVPVEVATKSVTTLRLDPTLSGRKKDIRWATDYEVQW